MKTFKTHRELVVPDSLEPKETWRILNNVVVISFSFMLYFVAYCGAANLQSSINAEAGLGTAALASVFVGSVISNAFLPTIIIKWLGTKWAMCCSLIAYMPYIACQLYPRFYTLIPAALLLGLASGPLWCANYTYLSVLIGRLPLIITALITHVAVFLTLLLWQPHSGDYYLMFILAVLYGLCDAAWMVHINTYCGVIFHGREEAAFPNFDYLKELVL